MNISCSAQIFGQINAEFCTFYCFMCTRKKKTMKKIAILASGEGTNAAQMVLYFREKQSAEVALVLTNRANAGVCRRMERLQVPLRHVSALEFKEGKALAVLHEFHIDFLVLAGFLLKVPDSILQAYPGQIVNIHPALLPKFGGKGMYGSHVHQAVLAAGETESGITIHRIDAQYDQGDILFQATCPVKPDDTPDTLAARVHQLEYTYYPAVVEAVILGKSPLI